MSLLVWNEKMETGIKSMDDQHKYWVLLMNHLHDITQVMVDKTVAEQALMGVLKYTRVHFADEERLLLENNYPDYASHKKLHDDFISRINEIKKSIEQRQQSDWRSVLEIITLMSRWLKDHIQGADQKYASFLKEKGIN